MGVLSAGSHPIYFLSIWSLAPSSAGQSQLNKSELYELIKLKERYQPRKLAMYAAIFISGLFTPFEACVGANAGRVVFSFVGAITLGRAPAEGCFGIFAGF